MMESVEMSKDDFDQLCEAYNCKQKEDEHQQPDINTKSNVNLFYKF